MRLFRAVGHRDPFLGACVGLAPGADGFDTLASQFLVSRPVQAPPRCGLFTGSLRRLVWPRRGFWFWPSGLDEAAHHSSTWVL